MNPAAAITHLAHLEAQRVGKAWDPQGIYASVRGALEDDGRRPHQVMEAAYAAVRDSSARTPAAIRWASRYPEASRPAAASGAECVVCGRLEVACRAAAAKAGDSHDFTRQTRTPAAAPAPTGGNQDA